MPYKQYAGSPDIFNEQGIYQPTVDWTTNPQIEKIDIPRPDVKTEADFALLEKKNITPSQFEPAKPLTTTELPIDTNDYASIVAGIAPPLPTEEETASEESIKKTSTDIMSLLGETEGKGAYEAGLQEKAGINLQEKEIQDLTNQMRSLQMESQARQIATEGGTQTTAHIAGAINQEQRKTAIQTLMLSAQLQTKQNNYSLAQSQIQRALDLKYQPIEDRIKILKEQYLMNRDELERIDKKRADATALAIKKQELLAANQKERETRAYNEKIQTTKDNNAIALEAAKGGAPASVIQAIKTATDVNQAIEYATGFLDTELEMQLKQMAQSQANADRTYAEQVRGNKASESIAWFNANKKASNPMDELNLTLKTLELQEKLKGQTDLTDVQLKALDNTPEAKKLQTLAGLKTSMQRYKALIDTYGYEAYGQGRAELENQYADLKVKWKEAANLGALTGPDVALIVDSVKPATGLGGLAAMATGGGVEGIKGSIEKMITNIDIDGTTAFNNLLKRKTKYQGNEYVESLGNPFKALIKLKDPKTGEVKSFDNLTKKELDEAIKQGYIKQ